MLVVTNTTWDGTYRGDTIKGVSILASFVASNIKLRLTLIIT